jgi:hypothetical protein
MDAMHHPGADEPLDLFIEDLDHLQAEALPAGISRATSTLGSWACLTSYTSTVACFTTVGTAAPEQP